MTKLKPCPFCGEEPLGGIGISFGREMHYVACENDRCEINPSTDYYVVKANATRAWNHRSPDWKSIRMPREVHLGD